MWTCAWCDRVCRPWRHVPGQQRPQRPDRRRFPAGVLYHPLYIWTPSNRLHIAARQITTVSVSQQSRLKNMPTQHISPLHLTVLRQKTTRSHRQPQIAFPRKHPETFRLSSALALKKKVFRRRKTCWGRDLAVFVIASLDQGVQILNRFSSHYHRATHWKGYKERPLGLGTLLLRSRQSLGFSVKTLYASMNCWWSCWMCRFRALPRRPPSSNFSSFIMSIAISRTSCNIQMQLSTSTQLSTNKMFTLELVIFKHMFWGFFLKKNV